MKKIINKGFWGRLLCGHDMSPNVICDKSGKKKRRYYVCYKCGKREYID